MTVRQTPLCVDLDGTLIRTDMLLESMVSMLRRRPWTVLLLPVWLRSGRAYLKQRIAAQGPVDVSVLPYTADFGLYLREQRAAGRRLILVTAADESIAVRVAGEVRLFDAVMASDGIVNLSGSRKRARLEREFGARGYDYAGNSSTDLAVWRTAAEAIVVNAPSALAKQAAGEGIAVGQVFSASEGIPGKVWLRALRVERWWKNLLVFVPLAMGAALSWQLGTAFAAWCITSSGAYLLNDLLDLEADRRHAVKRARPMASGDLSLWTGIPLTALLVVAGLVAGLLTNVGLGGLLALYLLAVTVHSYWLKGVPVLDPLMRAGFYGLRLASGCLVAATSIGLLPLAGFAAAFTALAFWEGRVQR